MQWNAEPGAGFSAAPPEAFWLPLSLNYEQVNVAVELEQPDSFLNLYRRLVETRRSSPSLQYGDYTPIDDVPQGIYAYLRRAEGHPAYLVVLNFTDQPQRLKLDQYRGRPVLSTCPDSAAGELPDITLRGNEGLLYQVD